MINQNRPAERDRQVRRLNDLSRGTVMVAAAAVVGLGAVAGVSYAGVTSSVDPVGVGGSDPGAVSGVGPAVAPGPTATPATGGAGGSSSGSRGSGVAPAPTARTQVPVPTVSPNQNTNPFAQPVAPPSRRRGGGRSSSGGS